MASNIFIKRSSTADKRPTAASLEYGELALNYSSGAGGLFYEDSSNNIIKVGPAAVGTTAPNATPAGSSGNSVGEFWYDTNSNVLRIWTGSAWSSGCPPMLLCTVTAKGDLIAGTGNAAVTALPVGGDGQFLIACSCCASGLTYVTTISGTVPDATTTVKGVIEIATDAEVQTGADTSRAVTPSGLQSKISDSISCSSSCTIASSTAVKCAYDVANAALPKSTYSAKGVLVAGTGSATFTALSSGTDGQILAANSSCASGLEWVAKCLGTVTSVTGISPISVDNTNPTTPVVCVTNASLGVAGVVQLTNSISCNGTSTAATPASVKCAYDLANSALPTGGGTMTGYITFAAGQSIPISGIQLATTSACGVVQIGDNINVAGGTISVNTGTTLQKGVVQLVNSISSTCTDQAATGASVKCAYDLANAALPKSGGTLTGAITTGDINVSTGCGINFSGPSVITGITSSLACFSCTTLAASAAAVNTLNGCFASYLPLAGGTISGTVTTNALAFSGGGCVSSVVDSASCNSASALPTAAAVYGVSQIANAALPKSGGTMTGAITFNGGQTFPVSGIQDATGAQKGVVQIGSNIDVSSGTISVASGSTTTPGIVQLYDGLDSSSTSLALTANQGCVLQDQINNLTISNNLTLAGTIDGSTGLMVTVTDAGTAKDFIVGDVLPNATNQNQGYFVIVSVAGTMTPPGGSSQLTHIGDWWISLGTGSGWGFLDVGYQPGQATTTEAGIVELATDAEVLDGVDTTRAVVPSALQAKLTDSINVTCSQKIASATAVKCAYDTGAARVPCSAFTAKGNILVGTASGAYCALPVGANACALTADSTCDSGVKWAPVVGTLSVCCNTGLVNLGTATNPILDIYGATSTQPGTVLLSNCCNCSSTLYAASTQAVACAYTKAIAALPANDGCVCGFLALCPYGPGGVNLSYMRFEDNDNPLSSYDCCIFGVTSCYNCDSKNLFATAYAVQQAYLAGTGALPLYGGTLTGGVCFCITGCTPSCLEGLTSVLNSTSTTLAFTAAGACCLDFKIGRKLSIDGGFVCNNIAMINGAIVFCAGGGCLVGISSAVNLSGTGVAASSAAVKCAFDVASAALPCSGGTLIGNLTFCSTSTGCGVVFPDTSCLTAISDSVSTTSSVTAASSTALKCAYDLAGTAVPKSTITAKGDLIVGTAASTVTALGAGADGCTLVACSGCATGLMWGPGAIPCATVTGKGVVLTGTAANTPTALAAGPTGYTLTADSSTASGLVWCQAPFDAIPVGSVHWFVASSPPSGYLVADGSCVSRTTYACLFAVIGTTFGAGNGTTTFQLPDLRGRFVRGWQSQAATGIDYGRVFGSCQCWSTQRMTGCIGSISETFANTSSPSGPTSGNVLWRASNQPLGGFTPTSTDVSNAGTLCFDSCLVAQTSTTGTDETRPANIALLPCIKAGYSGTINIDATPTLAGGLKGCTNNLCGNTLFGCNAGSCTTATTACSTAVGLNALCLATGDGNTALGALAGSAITTGTKNVAIGHSVAVASATASCQLAIGFSATQNWLTGDSCQNIRPGAGILSTAGTLGTNGQLLTACATGCGVCWGLNVSNIVCCSTYAAKGNILVATAASTPSALTVGTDTQILTANSACSTGVAWTDPVWRSFTATNNSTTIYTLFTISNATSTNLLGMVINVAAWSQNRFETAVYTLGWNAQTGGPTITLTKGTSSASAQLPGTLTAVWSSPNLLLRWTNGEAITTNVRGTYWYA